MILLQLAAGTLTKMGIVSGSNGKLNINDTMTRAEMATIFSKTCSYIDTAKEMLADKEQAKKDKEEADKNAEQEIQGNDYKKTTVTESKAYDGEDASFTNCTIDFASQKDSVLKMANGTLGVFGSTVKSYGYDAIVVSDNGRANVENSTVSASEANTLNIDSTIKSDGKITTMFGAVVKGGTLELDKSTIATSKFSSVSLLGGSTFEMSNGSKLEVTDKGVTPIVIAGNEVSKGEVDDTNTNSTNISYTEIITHKGEQKVYHLSDGSKVTLNSDSKLLIPDDFNEKNRNILMKGEGFFEVTKNPKKPFVIKTNDTQVEVLGTSFNVKAYEEDDLLSITVSTGKVLVKVASQDLQLSLTPNQHLTVDNKRRTINKETFIENDYIKWMNGILYFHKTPIKEVIKTIERTYNTKIILNCKNCNQIITGTHDNKSLKAVIDAVCFTTGLRSQQKGDKIIIY